MNALGFILNDQNREKIRFFLWKLMGSQYKGFAEFNDAFNQAWKKIGGKI